MRRIALLLSVSLCFCAAAAPAKPPAKAPAPDAGKLEFPANEAGRHAEAWFRAFNEGEPAMKKFLETHVAPAGLKRRPVEDRMNVYRDLRDLRGKVAPLEIEEFTDSRVKALARGERGGRFAITFLCEEEAPHGLMGLQIEDLPPEEGTPEGIDDAEYSAAPAGPLRLARSA